MKVWRVFLRTNSDVWPSRWDELVRAPSHKAALRFIKRHYDRFQNMSAQKARALGGIPERVNTYGYRINSIRGITPQYFERALSHRVVLDAEQEMSATVIENWWVNR
jgi:hypothetical protein